MLDLDRVGLHDDFLELGGTSLIAARMSTRVLRALGVELESNAMFDEPTVAKLMAR